MLVACHASKRLGRMNTIKAQGTLTKKLQWDPSSISMPKLLKGGKGLRGMGWVSLLPLEQLVRKT